MVKAFKEPRTSNPGALFFVPSWLWNVFAGLPTLYEAAREFLLLHLASITTCFYHGRNYCLLLQLLLSLPFGAAVTRQAFTIDLKRCFGGSKEDYG